MSDPSINHPSPETETQPTETQLIETQSTDTQLTDTQTPQARSPQTAAGSQFIQKVGPGLLIVGLATAISLAGFAVWIRFLYPQPFQPRVAVSESPTPSPEASLPPAEPRPAAGMSDSPLSKPIAPSPTATTASPSPGLPTSAKPKPGAAPTGAAPTASPGAPPEFNVQKVESNLREFFGQQGLPISTIACPKNPVIAPGSTFDCQATSDGKSFSVAIKVNSDGRTYEVGAKGVLVVAQLEARIQAMVKEQKGLDVKPDCGPRLRVIRAGENFECSITDAAGQSRPVRVSVEDDRGSITINI